MEINDQDLKNQFDNELEALKESIERPNILVVGQTGVGKSSLINTIFGEDIAKVSNTKPETRGFHKYESPNLPINIIDSEGYELDKADAFKNSIDEYININFIQAQDQIHIAWYCISISSARVLPYDLENLEFLLAKNIPTAVIFTQADNDTPDGKTFKELSKVVSDRFGSDVKSFQISNDKELNKNDLDLDSIVEWSSNSINDDNVRLAFVMSQKADMGVKFKQAQKIIAAAAIAAAGVGASPIPMSDAALLLPIQIGMTAKIFSIYGLNVGVSDIVKNLVASRLLSMLGKSAVGNILKFIPGIGTVAGAAINAAVASTITYTLGYAMCKMAEMVIEKELEGTLDNETASKIFSAEMLNNLIKQYSNEKKS